MNVTSDSQQLVRDASENAVNTIGLKSVEDRAKEQRINRTATTTQPGRKTDTVQISKIGAELSRASRSGIGINSMEPSTDQSSEDRRISSGGIENVLARYKEAQNFMAQIESGSINSTA
jgi:hypothetical protein